jgi:hypothetical protein
MKKKLTCPRTCGYPLLLHILQNLNSFMTDRSVLRFLIKAFAKTSIEKEEMVKLFRGMLLERLSMTVRIAHRDKRHTNGKDRGAEVWNSPFAHAH